MFDDKRSKKVIFVAHCIFNQNAKLDRCAHYPGTIREVAEVLVSRDIGIIQLPCPEVLYLGLDREVNEIMNNTIESEDTRIYNRMSEEKFKCMESIDHILYQIEEYQKHGFEVLGLIGINGSPTCGVETTWFDGEEVCAPGIFIELLRKELNKKNMNIRMVGIKAYNTEQAIKDITEILLS